jgi:hypothetical protein
LERGQVASFAHLTRVSHGGRERWLRRRRRRLRDGRRRRRRRLARRRLRRRGDEAGVLRDAVPRQADTPLSITQTTPSP